MLPNEGNAMPLGSLRTSSALPSLRPAPPRRSVAGFASSPILTERSLFRPTTAVTVRATVGFASLFLEFSVFVFGWAELTVLDKSPLITGDTCVTGTFEPGPIPVVGGNVPGLTTDPSLNVIPGPLTRACSIACRVIVSSDSAPEFVDALLPLTG